jgi:Rrf2 family protein
MQVALGRKGDYSVRAMLEVARHHGEGRRKAREIATVMDIPARYATQILADLVRQDLLMAVAGPDGGYSLARPPGEITLLDVVDATEGPTTLDTCVLRGGPCDWTEACPIHATWWKAQQAFVDVLAGVTLADLVDIDVGIEAGTYRLGDDIPLHATATERRGIRDQIPRS